MSKKPTAMPAPKPEPPVAMAPPVVAPKLELEPSVVAPEPAPPPPAPPPATGMSKSAALALVPLVTPILRDHAKTLLDQMDDAQRAQMTNVNPKALGSLSMLASISDLPEEFCRIAPGIVREIDSLGWVERLVLGHYYVYLQTLRKILGQMVDAVCPKP